jgi:hypothetical protein
MTQLEFLAPICHGELLRMFILFGCSISLLQLDLLPLSVAFLLPSQPFPQLNHLRSFPSFGRWLSEPSGANRSLRLFSQPTLKFLVSTSLEMPPFCLAQIHPTTHLLFSDPYGISSSGGLEDPFAGPSPGSPELQAEQL